MRKKSCLSVLCLGFFLVAASPSPEKWEKIFKISVDEVSKNHIAPREINDSFSQDHLETYLNNLDDSHTIFIQSDIDGFNEKYRAQLDDLAKASDLTAAFEIFEIFRRRLSETELAAKELLKGEFDFTLKESLKIDRSKAPWPSSETERKDLWRKTIKSVLIAGQLDGIETKENLSIVSKRFNQFFEFLNQIDLESAIGFYISSFMTRYDPHTSYITPSQADEWEKMLNSSFVGIGVHLILENGYVVILKIIPGGPADQSGKLKKKDRIIGVREPGKKEVNIVGMKLKDSTKLIMGPENSKVILTILRGTEEETAAAKIEKLTVELKRQIVELTEYQASARVIHYKFSTQKILKLGVIRLPRFYNDASDHIEKLVKKLKKEGIQGLLLDLRGNTGGPMPEAVKVAGLFIKTGLVVQEKNSKGKKSHSFDNNPKHIFRGPLVVQIDRRTASASEIVAGALQDYGVAVIVGDRSTFGKGSVQLLKWISPDSSEDGLTKVTQSKYYRITGIATQKVGVVPDIILPSYTDTMEIGESCLDQCLPGDNISTVKFSRVGAVDPYLAQLVQKSQQRIKQNQEFKYIQDDNKRITEEKKIGLVSLNILDRQKQNQTQKQRIKQRKEQRKTNPAPSHEVYVLTMKMFNDGESMALETKPEDKEEANENYINYPDVRFLESLNVLADYVQLAQ